MLQIKPDVTRIEREIIKFSEFIDPNSEGFTRISLLGMAGSIQKIFAGAMNNAIGKNFPPVKRGKLFIH